MLAYDPTERTRLFARVIGPYLTVMGAMLLVRHGELPDLLPAFMSNAPLVLETGAFALILGLVMIAGHHHWSNAAAIVISLIGLAAAAKGAWLLLAPSLGGEMTAAVVGTPSILLATGAGLLLVGLWLSVVGWRIRAV